MAQLSMLSPSIIAITEKARLVFFMAPTIGVDNMALRAISPDGSEIDYTASVRPVVAGAPATISYYVADVTPRSLGDWFFKISDSVSGNFGVCVVSVRRWAGFIDRPVSDILKLRTDTDRLRTNIRNQGGR